MLFSSTCGRMKQASDDREANYKISSFPWCGWYSHTELEPNVTVLM